MKKITRLICAIVAVAMFFSMAAFAADHESGNASSTAGSRSYDVWSSKYAQSPNTVAAWVCESDNVKVPVYYMGAQARAYNEAGGLIHSSEWTYNQIVDNYVFAAFEESYTDRFYSKGQAKLYTGTSYLTKSCPQNDAELCPALAGITEYAVNAAGQTYGSAMLADVIGYEPELIAAVGDNGVSGYVRSNELSPEMKNPKQADEYMKNLQDRRAIPVYDLNGKVVDSFTMKSVETLSDDLAQDIANREEANRQMTASAMKNKDSDYIPALGFAVGTGDGSEEQRISGYVSEHDINGPEVNTPDDAAAYMSGFAGIRYPVHLYDTNGNIIGEFWGGGSISLFDIMSREEIVAMSNGRIK